MGLRQLYVSIGNVISEAELEAIMKKIDRKGEGTVSLEEFMGSL